MDKINLYEIILSTEENNHKYKAYLEKKCNIPIKKESILNHLKEKVPCWEAEIDDNVLVYDCNLDKIVSLNDSIVKFGGCYIPKELIKNIKNIKRRKTSH